MLTPNGPMMVKYVNFFEWFSSESFQPYKTLAKITCFF